MEQNDDLCVEEAGVISEDTYNNLLNDTSTDFSGTEKSAMDYKIDKFKALYQCRYILAKHGTMEERRICKNQLERMKKLGIKSV